jgi:hypothetical protein
MVDPVCFGLAVAPAPGLCARDTHMLKAVRPSHSPGAVCPKPVEGSTPGDWRNLPARSGHENVSFGRLADMGGIPLAGRPVMRAWCIIGGFSVIGGINHHERD